MGPNTHIDITASKATQQRAATVDTASITAGRRKVAPSLSAAARRNASRQDAISPKAQMDFGTLYPQYLTH